MAPASLLVAAVNAVTNDNRPKWINFLHLDQFSGSFGESEGCGIRTTPFLDVFNFPTA